MKKGDMVIVSGRFDRDKGWIKDMKKYEKMVGVITDDEGDGNYGVTFADKEMWFFHKSDLKLIGA